MAYTSNPHIAKARRRAVNDVLVRKLSKAEVARRYGVHRSTIGKWLKRATKDRKTHIETLSSRPQSNPNAVPETAVNRVVELREETGRCAPILHKILQEEGITVSLSTVTRILRRQGLTRKKKQIKLPYAKIRRPKADYPGELVEIDTIHYMRSNGSRFYIYVLIDVCTRYLYAEYSPILSMKQSYLVAMRAQRQIPFRIKTIQADNGSEFSEGFYFLLRRKGIKLRHTRVRKPNDNAHVERVIRTIQEECFRRQLPVERDAQRKLNKYIEYYNTQRYHLGINCNTPCSIVAKLMN